MFRAILRGPRRVERNVPFIKEVDNPSQEFATIERNRWSNNITVQNILSRIPGIESDFIDKIVSMKKEGLSLPFIARYRQGCVRGINESQLRDIDMIYEEIVLLEEVKEEAITKLSNNVDTDMVDLASAEVEKCSSTFEVSAVVTKYLSSRESATVLKLREASENLEALSLAKHARSCAEKTCLRRPESSKDVEDALILISASVFADDDCYRLARNILHRACKDVVDFKPHEWLARRRGNKSIDESYFQIESSTVKEILLGLLNALSRGPKIGAGSTISKNSCPEILARGISKSLVDHIIPSLRRELLASFNSRADQFALDNFAINVRHKLLQPALNSVSGTIFGIDPGISSGSKCVVYRVDSNSVIDFFKFSNALESKPAFAKHNPSLVVLGDGTGSVNVRKLLASVCPETRVCVVSEAGASRYSVSELAMLELPGLDIEYRGCVSLIEEP